MNATPERGSVAWCDSRVLAAIPPEANELQLVLRLKGELTEYQIRTTLNRLAQSGQIKPGRSPKSYAVA